MSREPVIEARGLTKKFGDFTAVDAIDFQVFRGECLGFLGPNGAGKTTTINMVHCVSPPTAGRLTIAGLDAGQESRAIKSMIGVAPQEDNLDPDFTSFYNLVVYARYFDIPNKTAHQRAEGLLDFVHLSEKKRVLIDNLSSGMKRRLILARALINEPKILILDEPTTGLDPQARHLIWDKVRELKSKGVTIVLTTHYMDEAYRLCDRTIIMDNGRIIEQGVPRELIVKHIGAEVLEVPDRDEIREYIKGEFPDATMETFDERIQVFSVRPRGVFDRVMDKFKSRGAIMRDANLEDVFLKLTGRRLRE
jgi:lipooligosaccharide transport system ATP-binding protein